MDFANKEVKIYVDGNEMTFTYEGVPTSWTDLSSSGDLLWGGNPDRASRYFLGMMDEIRLADVVRSQEWIQTEYNNQNSPSTFFSVSAQEQGKGPVGYWSFDEGYGSTANDNSGQGNDGTITGAQWMEASHCVSGKCLYFDGTDDVVA